MMNTNMMNTQIPVRKMFCFQCEQTVDGKGCTMAGVCGKSAAVAAAQDRLTGSLITLAKSGKTGSAIDKAIVDGLFTTISNVSFDEASIQVLVERALQLAGGGEPYDMNLIWDADEDVRSLKSLALFGLRGMSAYASHATVLGYTDDGINAFFREALMVLGSETTGDVLFPLVLKVGEVNFACMELLDRANTSTYGTPAPATVPLSVEPGPFIVVTGHDLRDLKMLLEQTDGTGVNVYTHGEMMPAHGYPELRRHPQLKGNFGTAWHNQQKEFDRLPAPILWTTNCLMPPRPTYAANVFCTGDVAWPGAVKIEAEADGSKNFSALIDKAKELGGYAERQARSGINGGATVTTGFGHDTVLSVADKVLEAVKSGVVKRLVLVAGCDGFKPARSYYTEFVKQAPEESIVLTCACGKFRFNDLDLGTVAGLPRLLDLGQCNDAYSGIKVALALADALGCTVNDLPLSIILSWYEQKAVCVLLTLLHLGVKNIKLGPSLPAFVSPNVLKTLVETFNLAPIGTVESDLQAVFA